MLFWVRNLPLFSGLCKWDVTRYIYNLGIFSSIFNIFQFLQYSKRQHNYFFIKLQSSEKQNDKFENNLSIADQDIFKYFWTTLNGRDDHATSL